MNKILFIKQSHFISEALGVKTRFNQPAYMFAVTKKTQSIVLCAHISDGGCYLLCILLFFSPKR